MRLADGRALSWYEFGDPSGTPCLYLPGTPSSGRAGRVYDGEARVAGVRLISLDRPGYGGSDFIRHRSFAGLVGDVTQLLGHLGVQRCAGFGESGGAAFALALAHGLPDVITRVVLVAGIGPTRGVDGVDGMKRSNRSLLAISRRTPWLLRPVFARQRSALQDPRRTTRMLSRLLAAAPAADQRVFADQPHLLEASLDATADALRPGCRGVVAEMALLARPWDFQLSGVRQPVVMWHGSDDANVPLAMARHVAASVPDCVLHVSEGGHAVGTSVAGEILHVVASPPPAE